MFPFHSGRSPCIDQGSHLASASQALACTTILAKSCLLAYLFVFKDRSHCIVQCSKLAWKLPLILLPQPLWCTGWSYHKRSAFSLLSRVSTWDHRSSWAYHMETMGLDNVNLGLHGISRLRDWLQLGNNPSTIIWTERPVNPEHEGSGKYPRVCRWGWTPPPTLFNLCPFLVKLIIRWTVLSAVVKTEGGPQITNWYLLENLERRWGLCPKLFLPTQLQSHVRFPKTVKFQNNLCIFYLENQRVCLEARKSSKPTKKPSSSRLDTQFSDELVS